MERASFVRLLLAIASVALVSQTQVQKVCSSLRNLWVEKLKDDSTGGLVTNRDVKVGSQG